MSFETSQPLYNGFTLTVDNCLEEPIHRPLAIQGTGHLLALDPGLSRLLAVSESVAELFGVSESMLWGRGLDAVPAKLIAAIREEVVTNAAATRAGSPLRWSADSGEFQVICHQSDGVWLAELEEPVGVELTVESCLAFEAVVDEAVTSDHLFQLVAAETRRLLGYDRVMVYRLDPEGHGEVVGEQMRVGLEPYLGLRYPATDIPPQARRLFLAGGPRSIPGVDLPNSWLRFSPEWPRGRELDLASAQLRATSPIHLEYLANMGVQATLSIPLMRDGTLWGLIACHHLSHRNPNYSTRRVAGLLARSAMVKLRELEVAESKERQVATREARQAFIDAVTVEEGYGLLLLLDPSVLQAMCRCDGAAVFALGRPGSTIGLAPSGPELDRLGSYLIDRTASDGKSVLVTDAVHVDLPGMFESTAEIGGLLAVRVSNQADNYVVWFRRSQRQLVTWAGNPEQPQVQERVDQDGVRHLSPRSSFAKWEESVDNRSVAWEPDDVNAASDLRRDVVALESERTAEIVARRTREFEVLMSAASHDLEQPLRTQRGYLGLIGEELAGGADPASLEDFVERADEAVTRMQDLVEDLLAYGRLGGEVMWEAVDLNEVVDRVLADYEEMIEATGAVVDLGELPTIRADRNRCWRLIGNLVANSIKYSKPGHRPEIRIWSQRTDRAVIIKIEDQGIGIAPADHQRVFEIFVRLHRRDQYPGTGIGLAIAKRAAEDLHGTIGVDSAPGQGSTFWCRFHRGREVKL